MKMNDGEKKHNLKYKLFQAFILKYFFQTCSSNFVASNKIDHNIICLNFFPPDFYIKNQFPLQNRENPIENHENFKFGISP